jgi:translation elongation factor EF-1beta
MADDAGGGFFDKLLDGIIEKAPDILLEGGKQIIASENQADSLKIQEKQLEVDLREVEEKIRNNKANEAFQREKLRITLALEAIRANIAAAEDREFEALQRMEQQKMSRGVAGDVTSALNQIVAQSQAGIK